MGAPEAIRRTHEFPGLGYSSGPLYASENVAVGFSWMEARSPLWGHTDVTGDDALMSFPYQHYEVEVERMHATDPNHVLFVNPRSEYTRSERTRTSVRNDWIWIQPELLTECMQHVDPTHEPGGRPFRCFDALMDSETFTLQRVLVKHVGANVEPDPLLVEEAVLRIAARVLETAHGARGLARAHRKSTHVAHHDAVRAAKRYIAGSLDSVLRLGDVARAAGLATTHFATVFKRSTGMTVHGYVTALRLKESIVRLSDYRGRLSSLAFELGFSSGNHNTNLFAQHLGMPPSAVGDALEAGDVARVMRISGAGRKAG